MKTKTPPTRIPWTKILQEFTQHQGRHICLDSPTFATLWNNPTTKATIQKCAEQFLQKTKKDKSISIGFPGTNPETRNCLFYTCRALPNEQGRELRLEFLLFQTKKNKTKI